MRTAPDLFGFGLLDAVADATLLALADPDDSDGDGISGRVARDFSGNIGRFGRKALTPSLLEFNEGAFPTEQGVTDPAVPEEGTVGQPLPPGVDPAPDPELDGERVRLADAFVRFLAPPAPMKLSGAGRRGRVVFAEVGCARCHVPALRTGANPVKALSYKEVRAYSDLLLHDMGPELADICFGPVATPSEFRTEPLMGLRLAERFLHDGRAESLEEAILAHGGEASASRSAFQALPPEDRQALLRVPPVVVTVGGAAHARGGGGAPVQAATQVRAAADRTIFPGFRGAGSRGPPATRPTRRSTPDPEAPDGTPEHPLLQVVPSPPPAGRAPGCARLRPDGEPYGPERRGSPAHDVPRRPRDGARRVVGAQPRREVGAATRSRRPTGRPTARSPTSISCR